ncbi:NADPH-dependent FMN reductase [Pseudonocardia phyllosphaerae]|uniref:NADPH-dependent FMN reductase n=1 Tax=Pseudonocardia phyllosphaerae TaxID=3390502 RepID=UPI00397E4DE8
MRLLTISGSLRSGSINTRLLGHAETLAREDGHKVRRFDRLADIPPFNEDHEPRPHAAVRDLRASVREADAVLITTPEYSGSVPGQLKNLLDWAARPDGDSVFLSLPTAVISASPSAYGAAWARETTERVLTRMGAQVLSTGWGLPHVDRAHGDAVPLIDLQAQGQLRAIIRRLTSIAHHDQHLFATPPTGVTSSGP